MKEVFTINAVQLIFATLAVVGSGIGVWVNLNNDMTKLKTKVYHLEQTDAELKATLAAILAKLQAIEVLLAENQIKSK